MIDIHWPSFFLGIVSTTLVWYLWALRLKRRIEKLMLGYNLEQLSKMQKSIVRAMDKTKSCFGRSLER